MRIYLSAAAVAAMLLSLGSALAGDGHGCQVAVGETQCGADLQCAGGPWGGGACGNGCDDGGCGAHGCRLHGHRKYYEGRDRFFNCGCNGSYNYPVPPLYTYHWPGMYKAARMTDYQSPWRFPPIKPFVDDAAPTVTSQFSSSDLMPVAAYGEIPDSGRKVGQPESLSSKLLRLSE